LTLTIGELFPWLYIQVSLTLLYLFIFYCKYIYHAHFDWFETHTKVWGATYNKLLIIL